jgi:hypothetical protein
MDHSESWTFHVSFHCSSVLGKCLCFMLVCYQNIRNRGEGGHSLLIIEDKIDLKVVLPFICIESLIF